MVKYIQLQNKKRIMMIDSFPHFISKETQYLIQEETGEQLSYPEQIAFLSNSVERNKQIIADIQRNYRLGRTSLVLSDRVEHLKILTGLLDNKISFFVLSGNQNDIRVLSDLIVKS